MGFGTSPLGGFPFGFGAATEAPAPPKPSAYVRRIDPDSRQYTIDPKTGGFTRTTPTQQRVQLALFTSLESSTVQREWGVRRPSKMGTSFDTELEQAVRKALRQLVEVEKIVRIESVQTERGSGGRSRATVTWRDLATDTLSTDPVIAP